MKLIWLLPLLLCFSSIAQVNLIIEDKTETGFLLGVNGFAQNTEATKEIALKGLDTIPNQLVIEMGPNISFSKIINIKSAGNYRYIVTTNSRDQLQLRYRGTLSAIPGDILTMNVQRTTPMAISEPIVTASVQSDDNLNIKAIDTAKVVAVIPTKEVVETKVFTPPTAPTPVVSLNQTKSDSLENPHPATKVADSVIVVNDINPFDAFMADLEQTEFEFEKLQKSQDFAKDHTFTIEELKEVFNAFTYDASRLQLIRSIKANKSDISTFKSLAESLDYEISKQQFEEILSL